MSIPEEQLDEFLAKAPPKVGKAVRDVRELILGSVSLASRDPDELYTYALIIEHVALLLEKSAAHFNTRENDKLRRALEKGVLKMVMPDAMVTPKTSAEVDKLVSTLMASRNGTRGIKNPHPRGSILANVNIDDALRDRLAALRKYSAKLHARELATKQGHAPAQAPAQAQAHARPGAAGKKKRMRK